MKDRFTLLAQGIDCWNQWRDKYPLRLCDLAGKDLSRGYFFEGNFRRVNLKAANLQRACLVGADLSKADLSGADLSGAYLSDADLREADLSYANLNQAVLERADLRGANLLGTKLAEVDLRTTKLSDIAIDDRDELTICPLPLSSSPSEVTHLESAVDASSASPVSPVVLRSVATPPLLRQVVLNLQSLIQDSPEGVALRQQSIRLSPMPRSAHQQIDTALSKFAGQRGWLSTVAVVGLALTLGLPLSASSVGDGQDLPVSSRLRTAGQSATSLTLAKSLTSSSRILSIATRTLPDGSTQVIAGTADGNIQIWDEQTGKMVLTLTGHTGGVETLAVSSSGKWLVSSSEDGLKVWNPSLGQLVHMIAINPTAASNATSSRTTGSETASSRTITSVAIAPNESTFISSDQAGNITVWDMRSGQERYQIASESPVRSVAIAPDGLSFVSSGQDPTIRQWDLTTGTQIGEFSGHRDSVRTLTISPDGLTLASGSSDQTIKLWDLVTGELRATLEDHRDQIVSLTISADSQTLASSSSDRTLKLWNLNNLRLAKTLQEDTDDLITVTFAAANGPLISGGDSRNVNIWQ